MSSYEPSGKDIKLINHFTPITSNAFYNRKQVIQNEHTFFSENKSQIELNYLKKRQNELIEQMRTTSDKSLQVSILQELNSLTKQIAGKK